MYRHNGQPVSVFMLPQTSRADDGRRRHGPRGGHLVAGDRTFVLIAREPETGDVLQHDLPLVTGDAAVRRRCS